MQFLYYPIPMTSSPLTNSFIPNLQVNPTPEFNGNIFEYDCSKHLFSDVNVPFNNILFDSDDFEEWILFPGLAPIQATATSRDAIFNSMGEISVANFANFFVCND